MGACKTIKMHAGKISDYVDLNKTMLVTIAPRF